MSEKEFSIVEYILFKACSFGRKAGTPYDLQHIQGFGFEVFFFRKDPGSSNAFCSYLIHVHRSISWTDQKSDDGWQFFQSYMLKLNLEVHNLCLLNAGPRSQSNGKKPKLVSCTLVMALLVMQCRLCTWDEDFS